MSTASRDRRRAQQQQQQLLEDDPLRVPLLAFEQKLHRRPLDAPMPPQVDQMDHQRRRQQRQANRQQRCVRGTTRGFSKLTRPLAD